VSQGTYYYIIVNKTTVGTQLIKDNAYLDIVYLQIIDRAASKLHAKKKMYELHAISLNGLFELHVVYQQQLIYYTLIILGIT